MRRLCDARRRLSAAARLAALLLLLLPLRSALAVDVPPEHEVYRFLTRCELKGYLDTRLSRSLPYSERQVSSLLGEAMTNRSRMNPVEQGELDRFLFLFAHQLPDSVNAARTPLSWENTRGQHLPWKPLHMYGDPRWAWHVRGEGWLIGFNPHADAGVEHVDNGVDRGSLNRIATGLSVFGRYGDVELLMNVRDAHLSGDIGLADSVRYPIRFDSENRSSGRFDFDETDAMVSWERKHIYALFGKTSNLWAPGAIGAFSLSNNAGPNVQARLRLTFEPLEITWVQAKLIQSPPITWPLVAGADTIGTQYAEKWLAAHRYDFRIFRNLQIGFWDMVVYGYRGIDWDYLPPTTFLWSAEHYNHDRDDVLMGVDLRLIPATGYEITFSWLLDELKFSKLGSNWFGNKHGYQVGVHAVDPLGVDNGDLNLEWVMLRPYVYTHTRAINIPQHYGVNLGMPLQPNSAEFLARWRQTLSPLLNVWSEGTLLLHGANPPGKNVGGDVRVPYDSDKDSENVSFLEGDRERTLTGTVGVEYELDLRLFLRASLSLGSYDFNPIKGDSISRSISRFDVSLTWFPYRWREGPY